MYRFKVLVPVLVLCLDLCGGGVYRFKVPVLVLVLCFTLVCLGGPGSAGSRFQFQFQFHVHTCVLVRAGASRITHLDHTAGYRLTLPDGSELCWLLTSLTASSESKQTLAVQTLGWS
jgi:hypothetical protein